MTDDLTGTGGLRTALVTGGSRGLGRALAAALVGHGWRVVVDGRDPDALASATDALARPDRVTAIPGDVADPAHRAALAQAVTAVGRLDLLVNNASTLGVTPLPRLADADPAALGHVLDVNVAAPLALIQLLLPELRRGGGRIINVSSDAAVEAYEGWGLYGASKAALDQVTAVLAVEEPALRVYSVDPGDMATDLHRAAVPDEDPAGLTEPSAVAAALLRLATGTFASGRYRAADLSPVTA